MFHFSAHIKDHISVTHASLVLNTKRSWQQRILTTVIQKIKLQLLQQNHHLNGKVDMTIETVESVEKVAGEIADKLPDDTKLNEVAESIEKKARETVEAANVVEEIVRKGKKLMLQATVLSQKLQLQLLQLQQSHHHVNSWKNRLVGMILAIILSS
ncbi:hypothetical protein OWV82_012977 [Melia azedarach]|uniref:Uncharacterized protein n=1 Tax=Melia azedarach TaxID=155640 RepID=A0ACC1XSK7_MELAZ|nr:hypothetical protein OWV82_012977 [Melia azedarach]